MVPWYAFSAAELASWSRADASLLRQMEDMTRRRRDEAQWLMLRALARWPFPLARYMARHRHPRGAFSHTSYRFGAALLGLGRAVITDLAAVGTVNCHPGWIVSDTTYRDRMNLTFTFFEDFIDLASMQEFRARLVSTLLGADV
jgi:hypothetical protein